MVWFILGHLVTTLLDWMSMGRLSSREKDLEILLLRQPLRSVQRWLDKAVRPERVERLTLALLLAKLKRITQCPTKHLGEIVRLFQPETVLKWHRELVRHKWCYRRRISGGRPRTRTDVEALIMQFVRENTDWGYGRLEGELRKLGFVISEQTVANILKRHGIAPAPQRSPAPSWRHLMQHYKAQILACDFFTIETLFLQTVYVLFFIELQTRRVYFAGCTTHPDGPWVTQQARQMVWQLEECQPSVYFLIHDRDSKFVAAFDTVFQSTGAHVIRTPFRAPNANAYAERWVRSVRRECLNKLIVLNQAHLRQVLPEYLSYYNSCRPHQELDQHTPLPHHHPTPSTGAVHSRPILGGLIHDHYRAA